VDLIIIIVLVVLLLSAVGPRAGWYGTSSALFDLLALVVAIILVVWILRALGILVF
jgi:hypothetical protein